MKAPMLLALAALSISTAQAAEPTGTLTLACQGTENRTIIMRTLYSLKCKPTQGCSSGCPISSWQRIGVVISVLWLIGLPIKVEAIGTKRWLKLTNV
jgi:hypothetical protein